MQAFEKKYISLSGLQKLIKDAISSHMEPAYWIVAEISELHSNYSGHCYLELIEKDKKNNSIIAKSKATIWANNYAMLRPYFESTTGQRLQAGINVMVKVSVDFHPVYGMSINIRDIDPVYTLGEQQRQKLAILKQLEDEGIIDLNKELELPEIIESIAIISSESAAGYGDFTKQLQANPYGKVIRTQLFAAIMQGDTSAESITRQLERIYEDYEGYDAVVIIRGGGAAADLMCFDNYLLASHIAQFPIPIITGIGHDRDQTIADRVAHTSLKTPTAVAEFIIGINAQFIDLLDTLQNNMQKALNRMLQTHSNQLDQRALLLPLSVRSGIEKQKMRVNFLEQVCAQKLEILIKTNKRNLDTFSERMEQSLAKLCDMQNLRIENAENKVSQIITRNIEKQNAILASNEDKMTSALNTLLRNENHKLALLNEQAKQLDPNIQLSKGYSMTFANGKRIRSIEDIHPGSVITTNIIDGSITSIVEQTNIYKNGQ